MTDTKMVSLTIEGRPVTVPDGMSILEAAKVAGVLVPHYCYHPGLPVAGVCRMCLVDVEKMPKLAPACATAVAEGQVVHVHTPKVLEARKGVLEFLLINHPLDCPICDQAGECKLQEYSVQHGQSGSSFVETKVHKPKAVDLGPRIVLDDERCVLCTRCIRFTKEIAGDDALGIVNRGSYNTIAAWKEGAFDNNYTLNTVDPRWVL